MKKLAAALIAVVLICAAAPIAIALYQKFSTGSLTDEISNAVQ